MAFSGMLRRVALVRTDVVPSSPILVTLMMEAPDSSETSVLTRTTHHNISEDSIVHSYRRENLKYYMKTLMVAMLLQFSLLKNG
jgi:hypothetical protein